MSDEKDIGFYVGFIASSFSFAQFITSVWWGYLSDRVGRRPVLLLGLIGTSVTMVFFGFSHSLAWAIASRAACGLLNGNIGVAKCVLGEITDSTNQAQAFSMFGLNFGIGLIIGPMLGGFLSYPTKTFPGLFGGIQLLEDNPFLLPCVISAAVSLVGFIVGFFYLPETSRRVLAKELTHQSEPEDRFSTNDDEERAPLISSGNETAIDLWEEMETPEAPRRSVSPDRQSRVSSIYEVDDSPGIGWPAVGSVVAYGMICFQSIIFDEVFPIWAVSLPPFGLGFAPYDIGICMSVMGFFTLFNQLLIYPWIAARVNVLTQYRIATPFYILSYSMFPFISSLVAIHSEQNSLKWWCVLSAMAFRFFINVNAFTPVMILVSNSAKLGQLGFVNGLGQAFASFLRAVGPALGGSLWAWSIQSNLPFPLDDKFIFVFMSAIASLTALHAWFLLPDSVGKPGRNASAHSAVEI